MIRDQQIIIDDILELSPLEEDDLPLLAKYANDEEISRNTLTIPYPYTPPDAVKFLEHTREETKKFGRQATWAIREEGAFIGCFGLLYNHGPEADRTEIGYWIAREKRGRGYMTRILRAVALYFVGGGRMQSLEAHVFLHNPSSMRALEKAGFVYRGLKEKKFMKDDRLLDARLFTITKDQLPA